MDELVAFYRQMNGTTQLTAGDFGSNMTFLQVLTESVKTAQNAVLLASLPESNTEVVGSFGQTVLATLEKYFGRVESIWKPMATEESFEIVRRRLFDTIGNQAEVEEVCNAFADFYRENKDKLPPEIQESTYIERMKKSYPIHPEVFDRLYQDWSTLDRFQRTRGVLQYMATVIHSLCRGSNQDLMIMPGSIPLGDGDVSSQSTRYLSPGWEPVIESEVDGKNSSPTKTDEKDTRYGSIFAARRVARTIFFDSAPGASSQGNKGVSAERIFLGCAMPEQSINVYKDVLNVLRDNLHYLYSDINKFWYDTRPNLRREMESRKQNIKGLLFDKTIKDATARMTGGGQLFAGIHIFTPHADIPDEIGRGPRLVLLPALTENAYTKADEKLAFNYAQNILEHRGDQSRLWRNRLFFLAPDLNVINRLNDQCKTYLAWTEILSDVEAGRMNLDRFQERQAKAEQATAKQSLEQTVLDCYHFLLIPEQDGYNKVKFEVRRINSSAGSIANAVERALIDSDNIIQKYSPMLLKRILNEHYFKDGKTEFSIKTIWENFCTFYYLPRLLNESILESTIIDGVSKGGFFGYADGREGDTYRGFTYQETVFSLGIDSEALLIENDAAEKYKEEHAPKPVTPTTPTPGTTSPTTGGNPGTGQPTSTTGTGTTTPTAPGSQPKQHYKSYYGTATLDPIRATLQMQSIMDELISNFTTKLGVRVSIKLDIEASSDTPFDDNTVRAVKENATVLGLDASEFDE